MLGKLSLKGKIGLGLVSSYLLYTMVVIYRTNREIERRSEEYKASGDPRARFGLLTIWGQYHNPFVEYEHETIFHFAYNQLLKLFRWDSKVPGAHKEWRQQMPLHQPSLRLMAQNKQLKNDLASNSTSKNVLNVAVEAARSLSSDNGDHADLPPLSRRILFTWMGQSCAFVQIANMNVLTDPVFAPHIIHKGLGPKRITPSPAQLDELPVPDVVLVSHNHPDHLEAESVRRIGARSPSTTWVVPSGVGPELISQGVAPSAVVEMDWWSTRDISLAVGDCPGSWEVACVPAMHWSGRYLWDLNRSLWCSFVLLRDGQPVLYHMGDTGYHQDLFEAIHKHTMLGRPVALVMAPIGQYAPATNRTRHMSPAEAITAHCELRAGTTVGVHYGTFVLGSEPVLEPRRWFLNAAVCAGVADGAFPAEFGRTEVWEF